MDENAKLFDCDSMLYEGKYDITVSAFVMGSYHPKLVTKSKFTSKKKHKTCVTIKLPYDNS